jgi:hypothetical protein
MEQKYEFQAKESLSLENSFGVLKQEDDILLNVIIGINNPDYGWFEVYDESTGGEEWYAEGGLWFDGKTVTEYDGVFALPRTVVSKLIELGYDVSEVE